MCIRDSFGNIVIQLFPDVAPGHVENFVKLARDGFYDGSTFHRVIPGFMIQGGDPNSKDEDRSNDGQGGPGYTINAEFSDVPHKRGILSMARAQDPNSAGSQFFIVVADSNFLDGQYTVFGEVIEGMDVADKIVNLPRDNSYPSSAEISLDSEIGFGLPYKSAISPKKSRLPFLVFLLFFKFCAVIISFFLRYTHCD